MDDYADESPRSHVPALVAVASAAVLFLAIGGIVATVASRTAAKGSTAPAPAEHFGDSGLSSLFVNACGLVGLAIVVLMILSYVLMLVFVVKDARNRGVESGVIWMLVVIFLHFFGLILYLLSRPAGQLVGCEHCGNPRLAYTGVCPHCRRATGSS